MSVVRSLVGAAVAWRKGPPPKLYSTLTSIRALVGSDTTNRTGTIGPVSSSGGKTKISGGCGCTLPGAGVGVGAGGAGATAANARETRRESPAKRPEGAMEAAIIPSHRATGQRTGRPRRAVPRRPQSARHGGEPDESPANRVHRKSPVSRAFSVAGL